MRRIHRFADTPKREGLSWQETWNGEDHGLIACWERGREKRRENQDLAERAAKGELPVLAWKGGVEKAIQKKQKFGTLNYLATWQGLRGEDLDIDMDSEPMLVCSRTGMTVVYTSDLAKYADTEA
jgi:hypothetical protein